MNKRVGLFFGTFNPIHVGHLIIANHLVQHADLNEVWLIVTPHNPMKEKATLLDDYHRLAMVRIAVEDNPKLKASNIEFELPKPSFTSSTLAYLREKFPKQRFTLIMGEDNIRSFHKWKNYQSILRDHDILVYPRIDTDASLALERNNTSEILSNPKVSVVDAPLMKLSASFIRKSIREKRDVRYLLTEPVWKYIDEMNFYK